MIKILVVAIMSTMTPLEDDTYIFTEPYFESVQECIVYINFNWTHINMHLENKFGSERPLKNLYCVPEKNLKKYLDEIAI